MMSSRIPFCYQGSKLKELSRIKKIIDSNTRIAEPFFGSGIISGELGLINGCIASELNIDVYNIWQCVKQNNDEFFSKIEEYCSESNRFPDYYYKKRDEYNVLWKEDVFSTHRTSLFYYLINSCHGAMVRYGPNGFNTSFKLFLSNGKKQNVKDKIFVMKSYGSKLKELHNKSALDLLKQNNLDVDLIYCDPPYTNSASNYENNWTDGHYSELLDLLKYQYKKNSISSLVSNYSSVEFDHKFDKIHNFSVNRFAGVNAVQSNDILGIIGNIEVNNIESFFS